MGFKLSDFNEKTQRIIREQLCNDLRPVETRQPEPAAPQALVGDDAKLERCKAGVDIRIVFIALLAKPMDSDNFVGSLKPLRDAVCESIGIDDGDEHLTFEYHQIKSPGPEGVIVKVSV